MSEPKYNSVILSRASRARWAPAATLLILSPVLAEVMFGATRISTLFLLIPQICIYGCAALVIREVARRQQRSWLAIFFLGMLYAILQECIITQTSVSPVLSGGDPSQIYGWAYGISWVYLLWALVYESMWAIVLPIMLVELLFPARRDESWVGGRGMAVAAAAFVIASIAVWYRFTQVGILPGKAFEAPLPVIAAALAGAAGFAVVALTPWTKKAAATQPGKHAAPPWLVGLAGFGLSLPWFALPVLVFAGPVPFSASFPILVALVWAAGALFLLYRWTSSQAWTDENQLALIIGALSASMLAGYLESGIQLPLDLVGKLIFNLMAVLLLGYLAWNIHRHGGITGGQT